MRGTFKDLIDYHGAICHTWVMVRLVDTDEVLPITINKTGLEIGGLVGKYVQMNASVPSTGNKYKNRCILAEITEVMRMGLGKAPTPIIRLLTECE